MAVAESAAVVLQMDPLKVCSVLRIGLLSKLWFFVAQISLGGLRAGCPRAVTLSKRPGREDLGPLREFYPQKGPLPRFDATPLARCHCNGLQHRACRSLGHQC